ncbi:MAG: hypothetical protein DI556_08405 [Rhodovulum sulfidophilum]|uniref:Acyltransferase 3 domain-containing protein n=1 Tax=Rhodovulum sulfidophilum TaxID=35806 RepID=A0A2W5Q5U4_RHOSU|nr:MAG: hypothetical protein DI556_08405 [Rhodovulum sulfidophilum]
MPTDASTDALRVDPIDRADPRARALTDLDRRRIGFLRLVLVLALVFLHYGEIYGSPFSPYRGYQGQAVPVASILVSFILFLGFTAVPAMSAISGFLFFQGATARRPPDFARKMRRRVHSLVVPFLLWGIFFSTIGFAAHRVFPFLFSDYFGAGAGVIRELTNAVIGVNTTPLAYQLWFVRDLILTVAVSPLIWILIGRLPWLTLAVLVPLWILGQNLVIFHRLDVLLFFSFGALFAMHGIRPELPRRWVVPVFALFLAAAMARTLAPWILGRAEGLGFDIATGAMRILGALAVWNAAPLVLGTRFAAWVERNTYLAFYIHAGHYPPILFLKLGLGSMIDPGSEVAQITLYFLCVGLTISGLILLGHVLERRTPRLFRIISGGRTATGSGQERPGFLPT